MYLKRISRNSHKIKDKTSALERVTLATEPTKEWLYNVFPIDTECHQFVNISGVVLLESVG